VVQDDTEDVDMDNTGEESINAGEANPDDVGDEFLVLATAEEEMGCIERSAIDLFQRAIC
jgi:hypothetical protein